MIFSKNISEKNGVCNESRANVEAEFLRRDGSIEFKNTESSENPLHQKYQNVIHLIKL
jgi:hypothetical protein